MVGLGNFWTINSMNHRITCLTLSDPPSHGSSHGTRQARLWAARAAIVPGRRRRGHDENHGKKRRRKPLRGVSGGVLRFWPVLFCHSFLEHQTKPTYLQSVVLYTFLCRPVFFWGNICNISNKETCVFFLGWRNMNKNHLEFLTIILVVVVWFLILGRSSGVWPAWPRKEFIKSCHMLNGNQYTPEQWKKQWLFRVYIGDYIIQLCRDCNTPL